MCLIAMLCFVKKTIEILLCIPNFHWIISTFLGIAYDNSDYFRTKSKWRRIPALIRIFCLILHHFIGMGYISGRLSHKPNKKDTKEGTNEHAIPLKFFLLFTVLWTAFTLYHSHTIVRLAHVWFCRMPLTLHKFKAFGTLSKEITALFLNIHPKKNLKVCN